MEHVSASTAPQLGCTNLWDGDGSVLRCLGHGRGTKATAVPTAWLPAPAPAHQSASSSSTPECSRGQCFPPRLSGGGGFFPSIAYGRPEAVISVAPIWPAQRCIARHCTTVHSTALHCTAQYCSARHRIALLYAALHSTAAHRTARALNCAASPWHEHPPQRASTQACPTRLGHAPSSLSPALLRADGREARPIPPPPASIPAPPAPSQ